MEVKNLSSKDQQVPRDKGKRSSSSSIDHGRPKKQKLFENSPSNIDASRSSNPARSSDVTQSSNECSESVDKIYKPKQLSQVLKRMSDKINEMKAMEPPKIICHVKPTNVNPIRSPKIIIKLKSSARVLDPQSTVNDGINEKKAINSSKIICHVKPKILVSKQSQPYNPPPIVKVKPTKQVIFNGRQIGVVGNLVLNPVKVELSKKIVNPGQKIVQRNPSARTQKDPEKSQLRIDLIQESNELETFNDSELNIGDEKEEHLNVKKSYFEVEFKQEEAVDIAEDGNVTRIDQRQAIQGCQESRDKVNSEVSQKSLDKESLEVKVKEEPQDPVNCLKIGPRLVNSLKTANDQESATKIEENLEEKSSLCDPAVIIKEELEDPEVSLDIEDQIKFSVLKNPETYFKDPGTCSEDLVKNELEEFSAGPYEVTETIQSSTSSINVQNFQPQESKLVAFACS